MLSNSLVIWVKVMARDILFLVVWVGDYTRHSSFFQKSGTTKLLPPSMNTMQRPYAVLLYALLSYVTNTSLRTQNTILHQLQYLLLL